MITIKARFEGRTHKNCGICGKEKELGDFHKAKKGKYGRQWACKKCVEIEGKYFRRPMPSKMNPVWCGNC